MLRRVRTAMLSALIAAGAAGATPTDNCCTPPTGSGVLLTDLLAGASLDAGSVRFHDFVLVHNGFEPITDTRVFALDDDPLLPGFRIDSNGAFVIFNSGIDEIQLEYSVSVLDPGDAAAGVQIGLDTLYTSHTCCPIAFPHFTMTTFADPGPGEAFMDLLTGLESDFSDPSNPVPFGPQSDLRTSLVIGISIGGGGDADLEVTVVEVRYAVVPEPSTSALLTAGLLGLACIERGRVRRSEQSR